MGIFFCVFLFVFPIFFLIFFLLVLARLYLKLLDKNKLVTVLDGFKTSKYLILVSQLRLSKPSVLPPLISR